MKRYLANFKLDELKRIDTDVVIVGAGAAGLYTALNLAPQLSCAILNKNGAEVSNSMYAQGGIAAVMEPNPLDDKEKHFQDTLVAGAGLCDEQAVRVLVDEAADNIKQLMEMAVPFDKDDGRLLLTREGGHSASRVLHSGGDATGLHLTKRLYELATTKANIHFFDGMLLMDIVTAENGVAGVLASNIQEKGELCYFAASKVVIATGGIGRLYQNSTNALCLTGDGIAAACRCGAALKDMEFVQFHPTAFRYPDANGRYFLISESLRGEGGVLKNNQGEAFMEGAHPLKDLAPRDIVARVIFREMQRSGAANVYLDITSKSKSYLEKRFPTIYTECLRHNLDIAKDWIPVLPVQHYFMGGIKTNLNAETSVKGLYACGEAACTGVHGGNRLASNSLLECLVFGRRCAQQLNGAAFHSPKTKDVTACAGTEADNIDYEAVSNEIRVLLTEDCGIIRNEKDLLSASKRIKEILSCLEELELKTIKGVEAYNRALLALKILDASIVRKISVGAHYRSDDKSLGGNGNE